MAAVTGPPAFARGTVGTVVAGGLTIGRLTSWKIVISPTTGKPTLQGEGSFRRQYVGGVERATATVTPAPQPRRLGRPTPPTPEPMELSGQVVRLSATTITIANGEMRAARPTG
jgi:hypothetical protein